MKEQCAATCLTRRGFMTGLVPACAVTCLGVKEALALNAPPGNPVLQASGHKFDAQITRKLTHRQLNWMRHRNLIAFAKTLEKEIGRDKMLDYLSKSTKASLYESGKRMAGRAPDTSFKSFISIFKRPQMQESLTMEIVEDTDKVFEIKVTECLVGETYLRADAGEIGNAAVCIGDYTFAEGFNPKIKMIRDKVLTLGHDYCNHRYVWTD